MFSSTRHHIQQYHRSKSLPNSRVMNVQVKGNLNYNWSNLFQAFSNLLTKQEIEMRGGK